MIDLYRNIREKRKELGMTQSELAEKLGYADKSMIAKIEKGAVDLPQSKIMAFAKALQTSASDLLGWKEELPPFPNIRPIGTATLPVLGHISCGEPVFMEEEREYYVQEGTKINADYILIAKGDSMINARINDGDLIFIKKQPIVENGEIAAVAIGDDALLKRFYLYKDLIVLRAENPKYPDLEISGEDMADVHILGKAVAFQSDVK